MKIVRIDAVDRSERIVAENVARERAAQTCLELATAARREMPNFPSTHVAGPHTLSVCCGQYTILQFEIRE